jgi:acetyl-CoA acyltransferase
MEAYIVKGYRSAIGKAKKGGFKNYRSDDLAGGCDQTFDARSA